MSVAFGGNIVLYMDFQLLSIGVCSMARVLSFDFDKHVAFIARCVEVYDMAVKEKLRNGDLIVR